MKAPSWTNGEKLILLENVKTFDDIVKKKFSVHIDKRTKGKGVGLAEDSTTIFLLMYSSSNSEGGIILTCVPSINPTIFRNPFILWNSATI